MVEWLLYGCNAGRPFHLSCQSFFFVLNLSYLKLHVLGVPTRDWLDFVVVIVGALPLGHHVDVVVEECSKVLRRFLHVIAWLTKRWISCFRNMQHTRNIRRQTLNNKKIYKMFATAKQWNNLIITMLIIVLIIIIQQEEEENHSDLYSYILYMYKGIMYRDG